jgi:serine phosphatase RsbU (regulator of sigma subunit)
MDEKVLIIDDDAILLAGLNRQLGRQYRVDTALSGEEALKMVRRNGVYAVIISDYTMPGMNGIEVLRCIRQLSPNSIRIMLTGSADLPTAVQAVNEGHIYQIHLKPCPPDTLSDAIYSGIKKYRQRIKEQQDIQQIKASLSQASEVQKSLIPQNDPVIAGFDIAGRTIWCDETGGDYYDFIKNARPDTLTLSTVVGDVSGHGVSSALLMTTARAFIQERISKGGSTAAIMSDVNRQLFRDMNQSGCFVTLFYSQIDINRRTLQWSRAGHDPAILYDPLTNEFEELCGDGLPLGILADVHFEASEIKLSPGQVVVMVTDGVWETHNPEEKLFGKDRLRQVIRQNAARSSQEIIDAVMTALDEFRKAADVKDDATIVVIKACR